MIPYGKHSVSEDDIEAVVQSLRSEFLTCVSEVEAFEGEFAVFVAAKHGWHLNLMPFAFLNEFPSDWKTRAKQKCYG